MPGAGASSTTFWCRRCREQSRSPKTATPRSVPSTCTSTCRPRSTYCSTKTVPSPKADMRLGLGLLELGRQVREVADHAHPAATAAGGRLHQQRQVLGLRVLDVDAGRAPARRTSPSAPWRGSSSPSARSTRAGVRSRSGRRRARCARTRRSPTGTRSPGGSRRRRTVARHRPAGRRGGRCRRARRRAGGRRRRPRARRAGRRRRRSAPRPSRCRASGRCGRRGEAISARLATRMRRIAVIARLPALRWSSSPPRGTSGGRVETNVAMVSIRRSLLRRSRLLDQQVEMLA